MNRPFAAAATVLAGVLALGVVASGAQPGTGFQAQTRERLDVLEKRSANQARRIKALEQRLATLEATPAPTPSPTPTPEPSPEPTSVPIEFSDITVEQVGTDFAVVSWRVDPPAQGWVEYGETEAYGSETKRELRPLGFHRQRISGLRPATTYHFRVWAHVPDDGMAASVAMALP